MQEPFGVTRQPFCDGPRRELAGRAIKRNDFEAGAEELRRACFVHLDVRLAMAKHESAGPRIG